MDLTRVLFGSLAAGLLLAGTAIIARDFVHKRARGSLYMAIAWACFSLEALFYAVKYMFEKNTTPHVVLNLLENLSLVPGFLAMLALLDYIARDSADPRKLVPALLLFGATTTLFVSLYTSDLVIIPIILIANIGLVIGAGWLFTCISIARRVPRSLRGPALLNVAGALLVSVMYVVSNRYISGLSNIIPSIDRIFQATGALIHAIILAKHAQLMYVLPYTVYRLVTFDTRNGTALFTHAWSRDVKLIDEDLFSSILHGLSGILSESVEKGQVQEIKLENGVLLIDRDAPNGLASVLVSSKSSRALRAGLASFNRRFMERFGNAIERNVDVDAFEPARELVQACFSFVPAGE